MDEAGIDIGAPNSNEIREALAVSPISHTEANTYRTRFLTRFKIDGIESEWHSVKGSIDPSKREESSTTPDSLKYGVFYNPDTRAWLKIVPPESIGTSQQEILETRLRRSALQQKMSLVVSGLPDLANQVKDVEVNTDMGTVYGFTTPNIGPSLESFIFSVAGKRRSNELPKNIIDFLSNAYSMATDQAEKLYLNFGIWMADPNPGNILLRPDENGIHVVLIDFSNKLQDQDHLFTGIPKDKYQTLTSYMGKLKSSLLGNVRRLDQRFKWYCEKMGIPYLRDNREVMDNVNHSVAVINAQKVFQQL